MVDETPSGERGMSNQDSIATVSSDAAEIQRIELLPPSGWCRRDREDASFSKTGGVGMLGWFIKGTPRIGGARPQVMRYQQVNVQMGCCRRDQGGETGGRHVRGAWQEDPGATKSPPPQLGGVDYISIIVHLFLQFLWEATIICNSKCFQRKGSCV